MMINRKICGVLTIIANYKHSFGVQQHSRKWAISRFLRSWNFSNQPKAYNINPPQFNNIP